MHSNKRSHDPDRTASIVFNKISVISGQLNQNDRKYFLLLHSLLRSINTLKTFSNWTLCFMFLHRSFVNTFISIAPVSALQLVID